MSDRVSRIILLCEDDPQERLVRFYLKKCDLNTEPPYLVPRNASREVHGGNVVWVLREFPKELEACRRRHITHAKTLLIVVVDADDFTVAERRSHFDRETKMLPADPTVVLIPKRHIETWIRAALEQAGVNETDDYKHPELKKSEVRAAAERIHAWARDNPKPSATCVRSLTDALPAWRTIG